MRDSRLEVGFGQADITPPVGLAMAGSLDPRKNTGVGDPLMAKALVARSGGKAIALVGLDLVGLPREIADKAIARAAKRVPIDSGAIMLSCSHTHSGPYLRERAHMSEVTDPDYLASLPDLIAASIKAGYDACQPATMHLGRSLVHQGLHHRRVICKDGLAVNTWMPGILNDLARCPQVLGSAGPIDPEMWVARFDDANGQPFGVFVNFSLHVNSRFGVTYSADYPGVIAEYMRDAFGTGVASVFTPGACGNINPTMSGEKWRQGAEYLAEQAVAAARRAKRIEGPIVVDAERRDVSVPRRDPASQPSGAIGRLDWGGRGGREDVFETGLKHVAQMPEQLTIPVNAARIGPLGIASNAGELFVEWGLSIKRRSPFPHTVVAELTNDTIGYQPTREAFEQQGYETLVGANWVSLEGIEMLVDTAVELLEGLWEGNGG